MSPSRPRISHLLGDDHRVIDELFERFQGAPLQEKDERVERLGAFARELRRHIQLEEGELFPALAEAGESPKRLVRTLLEEHRRIEDALDRLERTVHEGARPTEDLELELINELWEHNAREEEAAYPWFDDHLSVEQAAQARRELEGHSSGDR